MGGLAAILVVLRSSLGGGVSRGSGDVTGFHTLAALLKQRGETCLCVCVCVCGASSTLTKQPPLLEGPPPLPIVRLVSEAV